MPYLCKHDQAEFQQAQMLQMEVFLKLNDSIKSNSILVLECEKSRKFMLKSPRTMWILCAAIICRKFKREFPIAELLFR